MRRLAALALALSATATSAGCAPSPPPAALRPAPLAHPASEDATPPPLRPASSFAPIDDRQARSLALFAEAGRVITHPRCTNCHPSDGVPRQGLEQRLHEPRVTGGEGGHGPPGLPCASCHQPANTPLVGASLASLPGNPKWALAPATMAWVGKSLGDICEQIKDPARNGGHDLEFIYRHMAEDPLVAWGWSPGAGRQPVPGSQKAFGELMRAWVDSGAACPSR